jgi:formylglycine-generating enzyme required for sulfatase activity
MYDYSSYRIRILIKSVFTMLLAVQTGCIPNYTDFVGATDSKKDQAADAGSMDQCSGDAGFNVAQPDVLDLDQRVCVDDVCVCQPDCTGKECGDDGCGGACGTCVGETTCHDGVCKPGPCTPDCTGSECGSDGCESTCGSCETDQYCDKGTCKLKCGDGQCDDGEDKCNCPGDCTGGCPGCCQGTVCKTGTSNMECGKDGGECTACSVGKTCQSQACTYHCGDGLCADAGGETCETCEDDCGQCPGECEPGVSSGKKMSGPHGTVWVEIPAGCFIMGCSPGDGDCSSSEKPPHEVSVSSFEMLETEVTEAQWSAVVPGDPAPSCDYDGGGDANSPVECIDWNQAKAFCEAVDPKGSLCTEAEWEYAARGGTTTKYYCGDDSGCLGDIAWYSSNSDDGPGVHKHDVKGKQANDYGLYDMLGNVWEWVADCWHTDYDLNDDGEGDWDVGYPAWTANCTGSGRVSRGGSFHNSGGHLRASDRGDDDPAYYYYHYNLGFRCCKSLEP